MHLLKTSLAGLLFSTVLATGCVQDQAPEGIARAIPTAEGVQIRLPDQAARITTTESEEGIGASRNALLGELAEYYEVTRNVTRTLNAGAGW